MLSIVCLEQDMTWHMTIDSTTGTSTVSFAELVGQCPGVNLFRRSVARQGRALDLRTWMSLIVACHAIVQNREERNIGQLRAIDDDIDVVVVILS